MTPTKFPHPYVWQVNGASGWTPERRAALAAANRRRTGGTPATGAANGQWKGDEAGEAAKHMRAQKRYPLTDCEGCGAAGTDRHHKDGNSGNNEPDNIAILCRHCHMAVEGRKPPSQSGRQYSAATNAKKGRRAGA